jgi:hypothetical protein
MQTMMYALPKDVVNSKNWNGISLIRKTAMFINNDITALWIKLSANSSFLYINISQVFLSIIVYKFYFLEFSCDKNNIVTRI